jgi:hypothetical protein
VVVDQIARRPLQTLLDRIFGNQQGTGDF